MREPERIERILDLIKQIWIRQPDSRLMQMISNISWNYSAANNDYGKEYSYSKWETPKGDVIFNKDVADVDLFYLEDDKLEKFLQDYLKELDTLSKGYLSDNEYESSNKLLSELKGMQSFFDKNDK
jgi:hypothetical protein